MFWLSHTNQKLLDYGYYNCSKGYFSTAKGNSRRNSAIIPLHSELTSEMQQNAHDISDHGKKMLQVISSDRVLRNFAFTKWQQQMWPMYWGEKTDLKICTTIGKNM